MKNVNKQAESGDSKIIYDSLGYQYFLSFLRKLV